MTIGVAQGLPGVQKKCQGSLGISKRLLTSCHTRLRRPPRGPFSYQGVSTRGVRHSPYLRRIGFPRKRKGPSRVEDSGILEGKSPCFPGLDRLGDLQPYPKKPSPVLTILRVVNLLQDAFDHDKGKKSAISGRRLHWRLSTGFFALFPVFMCNLVRRAP